jgi:hypothetical protein
MKLIYWSSKNDEELNNVLSITKSINKLYKELFQLEMENKKDTKEYEQKLHYLSLARDIEDKKYKQLNFNEKKKEQWGCYITKYCIDENFLTNYESVIVQNHDSKEYRRILCHLTNRFLYYDESLNTGIIDKLKLKNFSMNQINNIVSYLNESLEIDYIRGYLYYLNSLNHKKEYQSLYKYFIRSKYYLSFVNSNIEREMINNKFELSSDWYLGSKLYADLVNIDNDDFQDYINNYSFNVILNSLYSILVFKDSEYSDGFLGSSALIMNSFIKTGLKIIDKECFDKLKTHYQLLINNKEFLKEHFNDHISKHMVDESFENFDKYDDNIKYTFFKKK